MYSHDWQQPLEQLEQHVTDMEHHLDRATGAAPDLAPLHTALANLASSALRAARTLREVPGLGSLEIADSSVDVPRERIAHYLALELAVPYIELPLATEALARAKEGRSRIPPLLATLIAAKLPEPAAYYVDRVARLYLWGFDDELPAIARAALESALKTFLPDKRVKDLVTVKGRFPGLYDRIKAARAAGLLDEPEEALALDLRDAGNDILHFAPSPQSKLTSPLDVVRALSEVLERLYSRELPQSDA